MRRDAATRWRRAATGSCSPRGTRRAPCALLRKAPDGSWWCTPQPVPASARSRRTSCRCRACARTRPRTRPASSSRWPTAAPPTCAALVGALARCGRRGADPIARSPPSVPGGALAARCRFSYELRLHRARGYGALKAILDILADEEPLTLTEIAGARPAHAGLDAGTTSAGWRMSTWCRAAEALQLRRSAAAPVGAPATPRCAAADGRTAARRTKSSATPLARLVGRQSPARPGRAETASSARRAASCSASFFVRPSASASTLAAHAHFDPEEPPVRRPLLGRDHVLGQRVAAALQQLLQRRLVVVAEVTGAGDLADQAARTRAAMNAAGGVDAAVEIDGRDERLVAVGEQRLLPPAAGLLLAAAEQQVLAQAEPARPAAPASASDTSAAFIFDFCPSSRSGNRGTAGRRRRSPSTASPRNSSDSLSATPPVTSSLARDRCVSACSRRPRSRKR